MVFLVYKFVTQQKIGGVALKAEDKTFDNLDLPQTINIGEVTQQPGKCTAWEKNIGSYSLERVEITPKVFINWSILKW